MATDADTKVENDNANLNAVAYTAYPPPPPTGPREKVTAETDGLTPAQAEMHKKVLEHFRSESYKLTAGVKEKEEGGGGGGELRDEEKFWLVRRFLIIIFWLMIGVSFLLTFVGSLMIACCGEEVYSFSTRPL